MANKKLTDELLKEAKELRAGGMGWRPLQRYFSEKYPDLHISRQSLMYHLDNGKIAGQQRVGRRDRRLSETVQKKQEYTDSLKKLYGTKNKN